MAIKRMIVDIGSNMAAAMATSRYFAAAIMPTKPPWSNPNIITLSIGLESRMIPIEPMMMMATET